MNKLEGIPSTKGIYSKIKGELLAQRRDIDTPSMQYGAVEQEEHGLPIEEELHVRRSQSSERFSEQVPDEPQKPTISYPTDYTYEPKRAAEARRPY